MSAVRRRVRGVCEAAGRLVSDISHTRVSASFLRRRVRLSPRISVPLVLVIALPFLLITIALLPGWRPTNNSANSGFLEVNRLPSIRAINDTIDPPFAVGCRVPDVDKPRANAVLVILARNKELPGVLDSMRSMERHFNRWYHYPYLFLNDGDFNSTFREGVQNVTESVIEFGQISPDLWEFPDWADQEEIAEGIALQGDRAIMYGGMASYHHMCRFYSGKFYKHPMLAKYEWYWRVEPDVKYFCDITYDPFVYMQEHGKVYGFTIVIKELIDTIPNLFRYAAGFRRSRNITSKGMWEVFLTDEEKEKAEKKQKEDAKKKPYDHEYRLRDPPDIDPESMNGEKYNLCHFWSNFEIAKLDFFRSKEYEDFFQYLDRSGGFWNERWGDAPVHSLAAGIFLAPEQVHYFRDIGYRHTTIQHCPGNAPKKQLPRTPYIRDPHSKRDREEDRYWDSWDVERENGVGCRCKCDTDIVDVEGKEGSCLPSWVNAVGGWAD